MKSANILFAAMLSACLLTPAVFAQGSTPPPVEPAKPAATEPKKEEPAHAAAPAGEGAPAAGGAHH